MEGGEMTKFLRYGAAALVLLAAGCSSGDDDDGTAGDRSGAETTERSTTTAAPTTTTAPPQLGAERESAVGGTVTAFEYAQPAPISADVPQPVDAGHPASYVWAGLDVQVCIPEDLPQTEGAPVVSNYPWSLLYDDGEINNPSDTGYTGFLEPEYPFGDQAVSPGQCVRGWIMYAVEGTDRPTKVQYAPSSATAPILWTIPTA
jgi:hypothetical protein